MSRDAELVSRFGRPARTLLGAYAGLSCAYLGFPILLIVLFSFNANPTGAFPITGFTLRWYRDVFADATIQDAFKTTLTVAVQVSILSTFIGTAAAFPLVRARLRFRGGIRVLLILPIMFPGLLLGVSLLVLFSDVLEVPLSLTTVVIGQTLLTTPFVLLLVAAQLQVFDPQLERAASDLGANRWRRLRYVVLPLILPAILAGMCFSFVLSVDEFIVTLFLIGPGDNTLPVYIYTQVREGVTPAVNALVSMMLAGTLVVLALGTLLPRLIRRRRARALPGTRPAHSR